MYCCQKFLSGRRLSLDRDCVFRTYTSTYEICHCLSDYNAADVMSGVDDRGARGRHFGSADYSSSNEAFALPLESDNPPLYEEGGPPPSYSSLYGDVSQASPVRTVAPAPAVYMPPEACAPPEPSAPPCKCIISPLSASHHHKVYRIAM